MVVERKQSIIARITVDMSLWAKELSLENCEHPFRLDMNKVTVLRTSLKGQYRYNNWEVDLIG